MTMEYRKFSSFIEKVQYGFTAEETSSESGDAKYLRITDIVPYFVDKDRVPYCTISEEKKKQYIVKENDLLVARTGATTGYNLVVPKGFDNYIFASYLVRFFYDQDVLNPLYLKHVLKSRQYYGFVNNYIGGSAQPGMNPKAFGRFEIPYVEYAKQKRIAAVLSAYDSLIEVNNKRIKVLEQMTENLYKEWFVRFRFPNWHNTEFENGIPKGWEYKSLFEIGKVDYGYAFSSNLFCDDNTLNPVVRIRDIQDNKTNTFTPEICDDKYLISENSILVGMDGIFHMCLWNGSKAFLNQRVVMINSIYANYCNYLLYLSLYPQVKFWEAVIAGTTVAHLGDKHLKKMKILIPNDEFLKEYNPIFESLMVQKNRVMKQNDNLIKQRDLLLPRLMSGKLEV